MVRASERLHTNRRGGERASEFSSQQPVGSQPASQQPQRRDDGVLARPAGGAGRDWRTSPQTVGTRQGPHDLAAWRVL